MPSSRKRYFIKSCGNCKHGTKTSWEEPCVDCKDHSNFEKREFKSNEKQNKKEKEKKDMNKKTKTELLELIEQKDAEIKELNEELKSLEKYNEFRKMADELKLAHKALVDAGFTEDQAIEMFKIAAITSSSNSRARLF